MLRFLCCSHPSATDSRDTQPGAQNHNRGSSGTGGATASSATAPLPCTPALKPDFPQPAVLRVLKRNITQANGVGAAEGSKTAAVLSYGVVSTQPGLNLGKVSWIFLFGNRVLGSVEGPGVRGWGHTEAVNCQTRFEVETQTRNIVLLLVILPRQSFIKTSFQPLLL